MLFIQKMISDGKIAIDGLTGLETKDATVRWQSEHDLTPDGIAGVNTCAKSQKQPEVRYAYAIDASYVHMDIE